MAYATAADIRAYIGTTSTDDDALLTLLIARAQALIDDYVGFSFEASADSTRYFDSEKDVLEDGLTLVFDTWMYSATTVTNGDTTAITSTYYKKLPLNGPPYHSLKLKDSSGYVWEADSNDDPEGVISIAGKWAYSTSAPADIVHATIRLAAWLYRQRDNSLDMDRPLLAEGVVILPAQVPSDVTAILDRYRWRTP